MPKIFAYIQGLLKQGRHVEILILPILLFTSIVVIFVPVSPSVMDVLLPLNIILGIIILLTTLFFIKPLNFSIFPTILLSATMFRFVLNIATLRLILCNAKNDGELAAGHVIKIIADFVTSGGIVIGFVIFVIIFIVQFIVIARGLAQLSNVACRFTLDAMPYRRMWIDADPNFDGLDEENAKRREEITQVSNFWAAFEGAGMFVRADAIAGIIITSINIIAGLFIGVFMYEMELQQAATIFIKLAIGGGLVAQVSACLVSIATSLFVIRWRYRYFQPS